jgi:hypothetical protein
MVASRRPSWSRAAATWRSLWVSTPIVTWGLVVVRGVSWWWGHPLDATDGWRTGRAGRTARRRVCSNRLLSGHAFPVGAACGGCGPAEGSRHGTGPVKTRIRPLPQPPRRHRGGTPGPTDQSQGTQPSRRDCGSGPTVPPRHQHGAHGSNRRVSTKATRGWWRGSGLCRGHHRHHRSETARWFGDDAGLELVAAGVTRRMTDPYGCPWLDLSARSCRRRPGRSCWPDGGA